MENIGTEDIKEEMQIIKTYYKHDPSPYEKRIVLLTKYGLIDTDYRRYKSGYISGIQCAINKTEYFQNFLNEKRGDTKIKILSEYKNSRIPITVEGKYGDCRIAPTHLLEGIEPQINSAVDRTAYFKAMAKDKRGDIYNYDKVIYNGTHNNITITCKIHGDFQQTPLNHLQGSNCPTCVRQFLSKYRAYNAKLYDSSLEKALVYCLECSNTNEKFYKIGFTAKGINKRYGKSKRNMPYEYKILWTKELDSKEAANLEHKYHNILGKYRYLPKIEFPGHLSECYKIIKD